MRNGIRGRFTVLCSFGLSRGSSKPVENGLADPGERKPRRKRRGYLPSGLGLRFYKSSSSQVIGQVKARYFRGQTRLTFRLGCAIYAT